MREHRESFIPLTRVFTRERKVVEDDAGLAGYTLADYVRVSLGLAPEHPTSNPVASAWATSRDGLLLYGGKVWKGDVARLLNERCVFPPLTKGK